MHNFRSVEAIQNYANVFISDVRESINVVEFNDEVQLFKFHSDSEAVAYIKKWLDTDNNCAFLHYSNRDAKKWAENLNSPGLSFKYISASPLDYSNMESEHIWVSRSLANYYYNSSYSEYDFLDEIITSEKYKITDLRDKIKSIFTHIEDLDEFINKTTELYNYLEYISDKEKINKEIKKLYEVVTDEEYEATYNQFKYKHTSGTIHSSKGLEFKQVVINAENYTFTDDENRYLHYVAVTRPEKRLLIIAKNGWRSNRYIAELDRSIEETIKMGKRIRKESMVKFIEGID